MGVPGGGNHDGNFAAGLMFLLPLAAGEAWFVGPPDLSLRGWVIPLCLGVVASALILFIMELRAQVRRGQRGDGLHQPDPVVGLIFALTLGETTSLLQILDGIITVSGVLLSEAAVRKESRATAALRVNRPP